MFRDRINKKSWSGGGYLKKVEVWEEKIAKTKIALGWFSGINFRQVVEERGVALPEDTGVADQGSNLDCEAATLRNLANGRRWKIPLM